MHHLQLKNKRRNELAKETAFPKHFTWFFMFASFSLRADVMNLNNFMPTQLEDATPIESGTMDIQYSSAFERKNNRVIVHRPNIRYGWSDKIQLESQGTIYSGGDEDQSGETDFNLLYRFNDPVNYFPAISLSPTISFPTGKRMEYLDYGARLNLTSTVKGTSEFPVTQIHFNYFIEHNNRPESGEAPDLNTVILGLSQRIAENTAFIFDGIVSEELTGNDSYLMELGLHQHIGKEYYLGLSMSLGMGASDIKQMQTLALEKQFE